MATVVELKAMAKSMGIKGYSKMSKAELLIALSNVKGKGVDNQAREENYCNQNFALRGSQGKLTVTQRRRIRKKGRKHAG